MKKRNEPIYMRDDAGNTFLDLRSYPGFMSLTKKKKKRKEF